MTSRRFMLSRLQRDERLVITLLRASTHADALPEHRIACFLAAGERAISLNHMLLPSGSSRVSDHELSILAWLSLIQRDDLRRCHGLDLSLRPLLIACARHLNAAGILLPYWSVSRLRTFDETVLRAEPRAAPPAPRQALSL